LIPFPLRRRLWAAALLLSLCCAPARAGNWLDAGDRGLRSDVEILAAHGLVDGLVTTWPIPRGQLLRGLADRERLARQPADVRRSAERVLAALARSDEPGLRPLADLRLASHADDIRDFGAAARDEVDAAAGAGWNGGSASARLLVGEQSRYNGDRGHLRFDGSFVSARLDNWVVYGGLVDRWFGPGWTSSLILSNNARPFPKVGLMRNDPHAFETPWLSWIGPWQVDFMAGLLDGPRTDRNTGIGSLRLSFAPVHGLEIALARVTEFCGKHHPCQPLNAAFHVTNSPHSQNKTNDEASIELKYTALLGAVAVSPYVQFMNEDTGPFAHADTSYLAGTSLAGAWGGDGARWRLTAEFADSVPTENWLDFGKVVHGAAYNNAGYVDGFRYRDRTLGFSLDSDSRLFSLAGLLTDASGWTWRLVWYRALVSTPQVAAIQAATPGSYIRNSVSAEPVRFNQGEAGVSIPWRGFSFELDLRAQDRQPYPMGGGRLAAEAGVRYGF
jgi:hypothetical protein